jgi:hypothetical protein
VLKTSNVPLVSLKMGCTRDAMATSVVSVAKLIALCSIASSDRYLAGIVDGGGLNQNAKVAADAVQLCGS